MLASVVIRTFNEEKYLGQLLQSLRGQRCKNVSLEVVLVDSGSTDNTLSIAQQHGCRITHIKKEDFTFGRSLNVGCEFAKGELLVFISGHCIPVNENWLDELCEPLLNGVVEYCYGKQEGKDTTKFSEYQHFEKWFPDYSKLPQEGYFCNNANSAITRKAWQAFKFDESLTGLEDMHLAQRLINADSKIGYVSSAPVFHIHDETWSQVRVRYEREAYALHQIMPEVQFSIADFFRYFLSSVLSDCSAAIDQKVFMKRFFEILLFRFNHYWGTYKGNHEVRKLATTLKHRYFYPKHIE